MDKRLKNLFTFWVCLAYVILCCIVVHYASLFIVDHYGLNALMGCIIAFVFIGISVLVYTLG